MESARFDLELTGCQLLGQDVARLAKPETYAQLCAIRETHHERIAADMSRAMSALADDEVNRDQRLEPFWKGLTS